MQARLEPAIAAPHAYRRAACLALTLLAFVALSLPTAAQRWPAVTVYIVVPFGAGSAPDIVAWLIADQLKKKYPGHAFVVENKSGASGNLGTDVIAKARPDGTTIGISIGEPLAFNTLLFSRLPCDPKTDIAAISQLVT